MTDIEIAKSELYEEHLSLVVVKAGSVLFAAKNSPVSGFLGAIEDLGGKLEGASVAVHVVGKALALLCVYAKIGEVYSAVSSRKALAVFKTYKIRVQWNELAEKPESSDEADGGAFEKAAQTIADPKNVYFAFKKLLRTSKSSCGKITNGLYRSKRKD